MTDNGITRFGGTHHASAPGPQRVLLGLVAGYNPSDRSVQTRPVPPVGRGRLTAAPRKDLIEAAVKNATPFDHIGRGMKLGKEEVVGLVLALERYLRQDHPAEMARWNARAQRIVDRLQGIPGLTVQYQPNTAGCYDADLS